MQWPRVDRRQILANACGAISALAVPTSIWASPNSKTIRFYVIGDWGRSGGLLQPVPHFQKQVARQMAARVGQLKPNFILSTGDNFYWLGVNSVNDPQWDTSFENIYSKTDLPMPWYPVLGNHDWGGNVTAQIDRTSSHPGRWSMKALWYKLGVEEHGHPDVEIFMIDTVSWIGTESSVFKFLGLNIQDEYAVAQTLWLNASLQQSRARVKIVVGHHPIYSVGPHGGEMKMAILDRLLRQHGVTAYICGHDHCLYHIQADGLDYICSGAGSEVKTKYTGGKNDSGCVLPLNCPDVFNPGIQPVWRSFLPQAGFASFEVDGNGLKFEFLGRRDGPALYSNTTTA